MVRGGLEEGQHPRESKGREIAQFLGYPDAPSNYQWARRATEGEIYVRRAPGAAEDGYPKRTFNAENRRFETRAETTGDAPSRDVHRSGEWTTADKGLFAEMRAHEYMEAHGFKYVGSHDASVKQAAARSSDSIDLQPGAPDLKPQGIDGVYEHPTSEPRWVVIEAKFGDHPSYPMTEDGRQMSKTWITDYSRDEPIGELTGRFAPVLEDFLDYINEPARDPFDFDEKDSYVYGLWLAALAVLNEVEDPLVERVIDAIGNQNRDAIYDSLVRLHHDDAPRSDELLYPRPYRHLWDALQTDGQQRIEYLQRFIDNWYDGMQGTYWHGRHQRLNAGFFGYWCFELAAFVKGLNIDDTRFRDHPHYPAALVGELDRAD